MPQMHKNEIRHILLSFLYKNKYQVFTTKKLFYICGVPKESFNIYNKLIKEFEQNKFVFIDNGAVKWNCEYFLAKCKVFGHKYYAYCDRDKYRIALRDDIKPLDEDVIIAKILDRYTLDAEIVDISARTKKYIIGTVITKGGVGFVVPDDKNRYLFDIYLGGGQPVEPLNNAKVEVQIHRYEVKRNPCGTITRFIRDIVEHNEENARAVLAKHGLGQQFDDEVIAEAEKIKKRISFNAYPSQRNDTMRQVIDDRTVFMICNGKYADVAYSVHQTRDLITKKEQIQLDIYIPDVAEVVQEGCKIDKAAYNRCFETKLGKHITNIFPNELLQKKMLFSIGEKRLVIVCRMYFDLNLNLKLVNFQEAIARVDVSVKATDLISYHAEPNDEFEAKYKDVIHAVTLFQDLVQKDRYLQSMSIDEAIDFYARSSFDKWACFKMTYDKIPVLYRSSDSILESDADRFVMYCTEANIPEESVDLAMASPMTIVNLLDSVTQANVKKALRVYFASILPEEDYCDVVKPNHRRGYIDCRVSSPIRSHPDLYNQRILKRFIKRTAHNENFLTQIFAQIEDRAKRYNSAEYRVRQAVAEHECAKNAKLLQEAGSMRGIVYKITPAGVFVACDKNIKCLLRFDSYELSDRCMRYTNQNGDSGEIKLGDEVCVAYHWLDIKNKRIIAKLVSD